MSRKNYSKISKKIIYFLEYNAVKLALYLTGIFSVKNSTKFTSFFAKIIGKRLSVNKLAYKNIKNSLKILNDKEIKIVIDQMWDNLGRIIGEYYHISKTPIDKITNFVNFPEKSIKNINLIKEYSKNNKKGGIIFSGHIGNWEVGPKSFLYHGLKIKTVYRPLNNPKVEDLTANLRGTALIKKSTSGNREIIKSINNGEFVIILADQRSGDGELIKFFNEEALTTLSIARIALKYDIPLIPARSIRINKSSKFIVDVEEPVLFKKTDDLNIDIRNLTLKINHYLEKWIKEYPSQWFWVHNRWKK